jgi:hypothetical protein
MFSPVSWNPLRGFSKKCVYGTLLALGMKVVGQVAIGQ